MAQSLSQTEGRATGAQGMECREKEASPSQNNSCAEQVSAAPVGSEYPARVLLPCRTITASLMRPARRSKCSSRTIEFSLYLLIPHLCGLWLLWKARARGEDSALCLVESNSASNCRTDLKRQSRGSEFF